MRFDLDNALTGEILFCMENQDGNFLLDTRENKVISTDNYDGGEDLEDERFISIPDWTTNDGYRLMEKFTVNLKNPVVRQKLSAALNGKKKVFRAFKDILEQYHEIEKLWFVFKEKEMKNGISVWYNSLREEWGLAPLGVEPEDNSSLVLEDFVLREGKDSDLENAAALHKLCIDEKKDEPSFDVYERMNPFVFPGGLCFIAESASGEFSGFICAVKDAPSYLQIRLLEVKPEYRGLGLGKALLAKLLEKTQNCGFRITIDLPAGAGYFERSLHLENFKPSVQRFALFTG